MFPAHAGMDRTAGSAAWLRASVPRPRGDGPLAVDVPPSTNRCSPPTRGWTEQRQLANVRSDVFPAYAGMDRMKMKIE